MAWQKISVTGEIYGGGQNLLTLKNAGDSFEPFHEQVQCIYMDPPFRTGGRFQYRVPYGEDGWKKGRPFITLDAYQDKFRDREEYLSMLSSALRSARDMLTPSGSLFLHLDPREDAYARVLCDSIFGEENFVNQIIWAYQTGGRAKNRFSGKHDVILFYRKSSKHFFDLSHVPLDRGTHRSNHMKQTVDENGRACRTIRSGGKIYTYYDDDPVYPDDVWSDISHIQQKDPQRTGYDTQKPLALLRRIIACSTNENDLTADLFAGSGTLGEAADALGRRFILADSSANAVNVCRKRLIGRPLRIERSIPVTDAEIGACRTGDGIELTGYTPPGGGITGLDAVDQWSVGHCENGVFIGSAHYVRNKANPALVQFLPLLPSGNGEAAAILITDIYGNTTVWREIE